MRLLFLVGLCAVVGLVKAQVGVKCNEVFFDEDSFVCECSSEGCDFLGPVTAPPAGSYKRIISSRDSDRFTIISGTEDTRATGNISMVINHDYVYQKMIGFGGAFTDATGINVVSLSEELQDMVLRSYFGTDGIEYNMGRVPIAGSDFSTYPYSYDEVEGDVDLVYWALTDEDFNYKIPLIQKAMEISERQVHLLGSPWAPPPWMKENGMHNGTGGLLREMWGPYAAYLAKFIEEYEKYGLTIWGLTPQNEPLTGFEDFPWNTCAWSAEDMRDFIKINLGPQLALSNMSRINVLVLDHNRDVLPDYPATIFEDPVANMYVHGVAVHWYADEFAEPELLTETHAEFPDKFLIYTETCEGWNGGPAVSLGSWERAENYANNILEDVTHWVTGWIDWNMALDTIGGPNWADNFVDAPIIIDADQQVFYRQPMYYALGHFSKFIPEGSERLYSNVLGDDMIMAAAFHTPDDVDVAVLLNKDEVSKMVSIEGHGGNYINIELQPKSIETILFS